MNKEPIFSVVVPIYNIEKYLEKCIESIINQSFKDIEIILVNDGSKDRCYEICDDYVLKDRRVKVIHKENGGLVSARKAGAKIATGKYIACVDGDDWIELDYFEKFYKVIEGCNPDIVCLGTILVYENKKIFKPLPGEGYYDRNRLSKEIFPILIENEYGESFNTNLCGKVIKKEIYLLNQEKINDKITIGEDAACLKPCIYEANSIFILRDCLYNYRQNQSSMTKVLKPFPWNNIKLIGKHYEENIPMNKENFEEQNYRSIVHCLFNVIESQFNEDISYKKIKLKIKDHLKEKYYINAIQKCKFKKYTKGYFAHCSIKYRLFFIIYLYNRFKRIKGEKCE